MNFKNYYISYIKKKRFVLFSAESAMCLMILYAQIFQYALLIFLCLYFGFELDCAMIPFSCALQPAHNCDFKTVVTVSLVL